MCGFGDKVNFKAKGECMRILVLYISFFMISTFVYAEDDEETTPAVIEYIEMTPKFTVNLDKSKKYLAVSVQLMVEGEETISKIKKHLPALRHELIMIYSGRPGAELQTMEQREALRLESKDAIAKVLEGYSIENGFKDLFFTEFLVN